MNARGRLSDESGFTLVEMLVVLAILGDRARGADGTVRLRHPHGRPTRTRASRHSRRRASRSTRCGARSTARAASRRRRPAARPGRAPRSRSRSARTARARRPARGRRHLVHDRGSGTAATRSGARAGARRRRYLRRRRQEGRLPDDRRPGLHRATPRSASGLRATLGVRLPVDVSTPTTPGGLYDARRTTSSCGTRPSDAVNAALALVAFAPGPRDRELPERA